MRILPNLHKERQGEGHRDEEVFRGDVTRLEDIMAENAMRVSTSVQERGWERDAQDRNVAEEDADAERADCCGDRRAIHAPCRRLLEDTRPARAR